LNSHLGPRSRSTTQEELVFLVMCPIEVRGAGC